MADNSIGKLVSIVVALVIVMGALVPAIASATTITETQAVEHTYGYNSLDSYVATGDSTVRGDVDNVYTATRGDIAWTGATATFTPDNSGVTLEISGNVPLALTSHTFHVEPGTQVYVHFDGAWGEAQIGSIQNEPTLVRFADVSTHNPMGLYIEAEFDPDEPYLFMLTGLRDTSFQPYAGHVELYIPFTAEYETTARATYGTNSIHSLVLTDSVGDMNGTTFTPNAGGDWLQIPLHILRDSVQTYKVLDGATYYAPDTNGVLASFTAPTTTGVNSALTLTFTQDTSVTDATVYDLTATVSDIDLPGLVIEHEVEGTVTVPYSVRSASIGSNTAPPTFMLTDDDELYWVGTNSSYRAGVGASTTSSQVWALSATDVKEFSDGGSYSVYLKNNGMLYFAGWANAKNSVWSSGSYFSWGAMANYPNATHVVTGTTTAYVDANGNSYYTKDAQFTAGPTNVSVLEKTGNGTVYIIDSADTLYVYDSSQGSFNQVATNVSKYLSNGHGDEYYLSTTGGLYYKGPNTNGLAGDGTTTEYNTYTLVASNVVDMALPVYSSSAPNLIGAYVNTSGDLYLTGFPNGMLGVGTPSTSTWTKASQVSDAVSVLLGFNGMYPYALVIKSDGSLQTGGNNSSYQLGGATVLQDVTAVGTSEYNGAYSYAISDGALYLTGKNEGYRMDGLASSGGYVTDWTPVGSASSVTIYTNPVETETVADQRGTVTNGVFTPSANGNYLYIPIEDAVQYTYYVSNGSTVYAPDTTGNALASHVVPDTTGINSAVTVTLTLVSGYDDQVYSVTATSTDSDVVGFAIPYTVEYTDTTVHSFPNWTGDSAEYSFTEGSNGPYLKVPASVMAQYGYCVDDGAGYYTASGDYLSRSIAPDTTDVTAIALVFTPDEDLEDVYDLTTTSTTGYVIIPRTYGADEVNPEGSASTVYQPVRGTISNGTFTESATGDYIRIQGPQAVHDTYQIGDKVTYYYGASPTSTGKAPTSTGTTLTFTALSQNDKVYDVTATEMADTDNLYIPYEVTYTTMDAVVTNTMPLGGLVVTVVIVLCILSAVSLLYNRRGL